MNRYCVSDILLKSISCHYLLLDDKLNIKATNIDCALHSPSTKFEIEKPFLSYFDNNYQQKFKEAIEALVCKKETTKVVRVPAEPKQPKDIQWNICSLWDGLTLTGFELLVHTPVSPTISETTKTAEVLHHDSVSAMDYNQPFFSFDFDGKIVSANNAFADLINHPKEELLHAPILSLIDPQSVPAVSNHVSAAVKGIPQNYTCSFLDHGVDKVRVQIVNTPSVENGVFARVNAFVKESPEKAWPDTIGNTATQRLKIILVKLRKILNSSLDIICAIDINGRFTNVSAASKDILGYKPKELIGKKYIDFVDKDDVERTQSVILNIRKGTGTTNFQNKFYKKDGTIAFLTWSSRWEDTDKRFYAVARDATERKAAEAALQASEEKYRILFNSHPVPCWIYDAETTMFLEVNEAAIRQYGYSREEFLDMRLTNILADEEVRKYREYHQQKDFYKQNHKGLWLHKKKNNHVFYAEITANGIKFQGRNAKLVLSIDRTEQTIAEQELRKSNERFVFLSRATFDAIWDWDLQSNEVTWNEGGLKMFGISDTSIARNVKWRFENLHPQDKERVEKKINHHIINNIPNWEDEYRVKAGEDYKYIQDRGYIIYDEQRQPVRMIGAMQDLTDRKKHENMLQNLNHSLEKRANELAESNSELERFAYVTSHDLQEPLRMVTSFLQLLEKRYKDKLDNKAHEYIHYAVDGAERMKRLILDLLEYSRVNSSKHVIEDVDVDSVVNELKSLYSNILMETNGTITAEKLPVVKGNRTQIQQLFQNIIGNAIKYKSSAAPIVNISFGEEGGFYKFAITDNGIGIEPKFFHKIFIIFQRLHNREEYSGTGIGLAICKKIIDKHGGKIWVISEPGKGSTFYFTLPKR